MPTEPETPTVAEIVNAAADAVDPTGEDQAVAEFFARFEDRDEPVTAVLGEIEEKFIETARAIDVDLTDQALKTAVDVATYLAFRRDMLGTEPEELIRIATRAEEHRA